MRKQISTRFILTIVCFMIISVQAIAQVDINTPISPAQVQNEGIKSQGGEIILLNSNVRSTILNKSDDEYRRIGNYKVKGNSYLLKGNNVSELFSTMGHGSNFSLIYDTYTQELGVVQQGKESFISLSLNDVDSFCMKVDNDKILTGPMMFKNMTKIDPSVKSYMQVLIAGGKYNLYRSYYADMKNVSVNIAQNNLKEFEIKSDYYFVDNSKGADKKLVKIKASLKNLKEYFKTEASTLKILDNSEPEQADQKLIAFFDAMNRQ